MRFIIADGRGPKEFGVDNGIVRKSDEKWGEGNARHHTWKRHTRARHQWGLHTAAAPGRQPSKADLAFLEHVSDRRWVDMSELEPTPMVDAPLEELDSPLARDYWGFVALDEAALVEDDLDMVG